jgi:tetratricopeptide (TPR) repeat protein
MTRKNSVALALLLLALVWAAPGCNVINTLRAKNSLNEGVREFNKGKYDIAETKFNEALEMQPDLQNADVFRAQAIYQQFKEMKMTDETAPQVEQAFNRVVKAFDDLIEKHKDNPQIVDQAYAFKGDLYDTMSKLIAQKDQAKADQLRDQRFKILEERASRPGASDQVKASVYYSIGKYHWDQAFLFTKEYEDLSGCPDLMNDTNFVDKCFKTKPIPPEVAQKVREHVDKAKSYLQKSLQAMPEWATAHSVYRLTLRQEVYITPDANARQPLLDEYKRHGELAMSLQDSEQSQLMKAK